jgi:hypothetical protein
MHVEMINACKMFTGKSEAKKQLQSARHGYIMLKRILKKQFAKIGAGCCLPQIEFIWGSLNTALNLWIPYKARNFLNS